MQQIRQTNRVLHVSASNCIISDLHLTGANAKKLLTNHRLRLPITKQTFNKNLEHVMNEPTDAKLLGSKIKRHLISKESYYERGRTVSNRSF